MFNEMPPPQKKANKQKSMYSGMSQIVVTGSNK